jgi:hypothetical protein
MFRQPEMAAKIAEPRRRDLIAEADAYRLAQRRRSRANLRLGRLGRVAQPPQLGPGLYRVHPSASLPECREPAAIPRETAMKGGRYGRRVRAILVGVIVAAASAAVVPAASAAVTVFPAGTGIPRHPPIVRDGGVLGCTSLSRVQQVAATQYPRIRAEFADSQWPDLRLAGTAYVDLATALLRDRHAYGGETAWFYVRLSAACREHGHPLNGNA